MNTQNRKTGWYWVKPVHGDEVWVPAKYVAEVRCWYSIDFFGLPDSRMAEIGGAITRG